MALLRLEPLEDRIVLDGAIAVDIATPPTQTADTHVLVISDAVADAEAVANAAAEDVVVLTYDADSNDPNALSQLISDALGGEQAESIAFFTGGNEGEIALFDDMAVNEVSIKTQQMTDFWSDIGSYIYPTGTVNIFGCNVAGSSEGVQLLEAIEVFLNDSGSNIEINASTDLTGHEDLGGDWDLEYSSSADLLSNDTGKTDAGDIYFDMEAMDSWQNVLAPTIFAGPIGGGNNPIEGGAAAFQLVRLVDQPSGGGIVVLDITHNGSSSDVHVLQDQLTFTSANYLTSQQLQYVALEDGIVEGIESVDITLSVNVGLTTAANYLSGTPDVIHTINLIDADSVPLVEIGKNTAETADGPGFLADPNLPDYVTAFFPVTLSRPVDYSVTVNYTTADLTATSIVGPNQDYIGETGSVTFAPGEVVKIIDIDILRDVNDESDETFRVVLTGVVGGSGVAEISGSAGSTTQTIVDDDDPRGVSFSNHPYGIHLADGSNGAFTLTLDEQPIDDVIVTLQVNGANPGTFFGGGLTETLTFTKYDWLLPQKVRVTGGATAGTQTVSIQSITSVGDSDYNGLVDASTLQFTNVGIIPVNTPFFTITSGQTVEGTTVSGQSSLSVGITILNLGSTTNPTTFTVDIASNDLTGPVGLGHNGTGDFTPIPLQTLVINYTGGVSTGQTVTVLIDQDSHFELTETFILELSNPTASSGPTPVFNTSQGVYDIVDDDSAPIPTSNVAGPERGSESGRDFAFINTSNQLTDLSYLYYGYGITHVNGSATVADNDFIPISYGVVIEPGSTGVTVPAVIAVPDDIVEADETINQFVTNSFDSGSNTIIASVLSTILNDDTTPGYYVTNATGSEASGQLDFTIGITNRSVADMLANAPTESVNYSTANGSAVAPGDYTSISSTTLTFNTLTGMQQIVSVPVVNDLVFEGNETLFVNLSNPLPSSPTQFLLIDGQGLGTILDNDAQPTISVSDASVVEGGNLAFDVTLSNASFQTITVLFSTADGIVNPATLADSDYTQIVNQLITFNPGVVIQTVNVSTTSDNDFEADEQMFVNLSSPSNATIADGQGEGTILNDDAQPTISISDAVIGEGGILGFNVTLSTPSTQTITVLASTADGITNPATLADNDYTQITNQLVTFNPGDVSEFVSVSTIADTKFEPNEQMFVNLTSPTNATILDGQGVGTITNNDAQPTISISDETVTEGGTLNFTVTLSNASYQTISVNYATADGTATIADNDYTAISPAQTLTFLSGSLSQTVSVSTIADTKFELNENLFVNLTSPSNATIADAQGVGTITNNDLQPTISISDATVTEGGTLVFTATLSNASYQNISVNYATADGTATIADNDYTAISPAQTLTFLAGSTSETISVATIADTKFELNENLFVNLTSPSNATIADAQGVGTITNNDVQPTISISDATVTEGGTLVFTATLSNASYQNISVNYATADGTATIADNDYTAISPAQTLTFLAGSTSETISVATIADTKFELNENLFVNLTSPTNATILDNQGEGTITNDDALPTISISDETVTEGGTLTFTVTLSNASYQDISVDYATSDGTATVADNDYTAISPAQTLTFLSGSVSQTISVITLSDTKFELNENLFVDLTNPTNATILDNQGQGTITDDDVQPTISISDATVTEGGTLVFTVSLSNASYQDITVDYATLDGTATVADSDYIAISPAQTLTFLSGSTSETISVVTTADTKFELNENLFVDLTNPSNATILDNQGEGTITDDDVQPTISISDATVSEGGTLVFTVSLSNASYQDITVDYATLDGTATIADSDYTAISPAQTLTFLSGSTSETISVVTTADTKFELNENLFVDLTNPTNATIVDNQGEGTITNDDAQPTISISDATVTEGGTLVFTVSLSNASYQDITVDYVTADGTATVADNDYTPISPAQTLTFLSGSVSETISVITIADAVFELDENLFVNLTAPTNATVADAQGEGTIQNDDAQPTISISDATVTEGGTFVFTVTLSDVSSQTITVDYATSDGTATIADSDYTAISPAQTLTFLPGSTSETISVVTTADTKFELNENLFVDLTNPSNATILDNQGEGTITDDDVQPTISISDATVTEGGTLVFTVTLSNASYQDITVDYATLDGTATVADNDYTAISPAQTLTFLSGSTSETISVVTTADTKFELNENLFVDLTNSINATILDNQGEGTITDDDVQPTISISDATVTEGGTLVFTVNLSNASYQDITVDFATLDGTATVADNDYTPISPAQTLTFISGSTSETISVVTTADTKFELNENLFVDLTNPTNATILDNQGEGTITNDDAQPTISISDETVIEGGTLVFTVTLSNASYQDITVDFATLDGTATVADNDYTAIFPAQTLTFLSGSTSETISVVTTADTKFELNENLFVNLTAPTNATIADAQGEGTITNDDAQPTISISDETVIEGGTLVFTVTLSNASYQDITVDFATLDGTATVADNDYTAIFPAQTLTFLSGSTSETISVVTTTDTKFELNENLFVNLTAPTNATIADAQGEGTITNDDLQPTISISDATVTEGGTLVFTATLSNASYQDITVDYATLDGTATVADNDYTTISPAQTLTFLSGSTSETISVVTTADTKFELNENLFVDLTNPTNATILDNQGEGSITDDDVQPTISISDATVTEGGTLVFTVTLSNASYQDITVDYATLDGTATVADNDYSVISPAQTLTFLSGSVSETISVVTIADITFEPNENLFVDLTNPTNATILDNQGEGTITNDDAQPTISVSDDVVTEGGVLNFVVTLSNPSYQTVTVLISTADGSMTPATLADNDYIQIINQLITFDPGDTSASVTVNTVSDTKFELDEQMLVNLSSPTNATIADAVGDGNILNDDTAPTITIDDTNGGNVGLAEVLEGNPPDANQLVFSVSLSNLSYQDIVFSYNTIDGSATIADNDYTQVSGGTFTILAGTSSQTFTVDVTADLTNEADEAISLNIEKTSGTVTGQDVFTLIGAGVILNDDAQPTISISDASALEGNALNFTVTLSNPSDQDITVLYSTADGFINAATLADNDYTQVSNQLITFLAGSTSATATVLTTADTNFELDEQLFVNLSSSTNASILDGQGVGTIINDDGVPLISIDDVTVTEGGTLTFTVSLSSSSVQIVTVDYATSDGTATVADSDYTPISPAQTLTFLPGNTSQTITVLTTADTKFELNENLFVDLSAASNAAIADNQGEGTITDDDVQPTISISDASVAEGGTLVFTVTLSNASYQDITVDYSTADGTATVADNDYTPISPAQTLTFLSGSVSETISVVTTADPKFELNENLFVNLTTPTNATILDNQGEGTILNDEALPTISISDATVTEGGTLTFTLTLSHESYQDITVDFSTSDGTATIADNDYTAISPAQTLTFLAGSTSETITVATTADTKFELNENLFVDLTNPTNATIADNQGEGTITDDDVQPTISISDATVTEGGTLTFTVTLSNASYQDITVDYVTADGTATVADNDYTAISPVQTLTFLSGSTSETITVATTADTKFELNENLFVNLTNPTNATIADAQGEGTITDDDVQPTISISDATTIEGGTLVFTVTLSNASYQDITVNYATADGTATIADNDYTAISPAQTLTFFSGSVSETISVVTIADTTFEPNEQLLVNLTAPTNATIVDNQGEGTILNDDGIPHISISDETVVEGGTFTFTVTLNAASTQTVTVEFSTADGTINPATLADNDYIQVTNQLITFLPGSLSETVSVSTVGDTKFELNEQLFVNLTNATNSLIVDPQGEGIITNDDTAPTVTVDDNNGVNLGLAEVLEGDPPDMNQLTFSVTLSNASYEDIVFIYDTSDGTATLADSDYTPVVGQTFTILSGDTTGLFTVDVTADNTFEPDETVNVALAVTGGTVTGSTSFSFQGVILADDDAPTVTIDDNNGVNVGLAEVIEGNSPDMNQLTFTLTLSNPSSEDIVFTYNTSDGTATLVDSDYTPVVGQTFTILAGDTTGLFTVDVTADNTFEPDETVNVGLNVTGGTVTGSTSFNFQGVILNDDLAPTVTIDDNNGANVGLAEVLEGNPPDMNQLTFTVTLSNPSSEDIVFTYNTSDGTATLADSDYTSVVGQTFTILAGDTTGLFTVDVTADNTFEPDETVNVALSVTGGSVTGASSFNFQGVILADDNAPTVTVDDNNGANVGLAEVLEGNPPDMNQLTFSVTLSNPSSEDIVFTYNTSDGTATIADSDYTSVIGQTFTILAGDTTGLFTVDVTADNTFEPDETVNVALNVTGGVVTGSTNFNFQGVILADDNAPTVTIEDVNGGNQGVTEVLEGDPPDMNELIFTVTLSNPSSEDIVFIYNTIDGTATVADDDYTPEVGEVLTILAGDTTGTITVAVTADNTYEPDENIELTLNVTSGTVTGATMISAEGVILADDNAPTLTVVDNNGSDAGVADVSEGNPPEDNVITYTVTLSNPSHEDIELTYHTTDGTATAADNDYVPVAPTTVIIPAGSTTMSLSVDINADTTLEANETVHLNISVTGGSVAGSTSLVLDGVLINDDTISSNFVIPPQEYCEDNLLGCYANKIEEIFLPQPLKSASPTFAFTPFGWTIEILEFVREFSPEIVTSQFFGTADEGNLDGYFTIFITQQPEKPLVIELEAQGISDGSVSQKTVVFTPDNWATPQVIVVKDLNFNPEEASEIITTKVGSGNVYKDIDAPDVNIPDNTDKPRDGAENEPQQSK